MSSNTMRKVIVPILFILILTTIAIYFITNAYKKEVRQNAKDAQAAALAEEVKSPEELVDMDSLEYTLTGILTVKNTEDQAFTIKPCDEGKDFLLKYDGTTMLLGKHGNSISLDQLKLGEIVDVTYSVHSGKLKKVQISDKAFTMSDVSKFTIDEKKKMIVVGDDTYKLDGDVVISHGQELAKLMDVTDMDTISVKGVDRTVYSITIDNGHGYIRLKNDAYFVGGWIEVGQEIIKPVKSDMLLPVPEGAYHVRITNRGYAGEKDVVIERDKEEIIDLDEIDIQEVAIGHVEFDISPDYAQLKIDGEMTEFEDRVPLEYGVHQVHVELAGYKSVDTNIKILSEYASISITLEKDDSSTSSSSSSTAKTDSGDYSYSGTSSSTSTDSNTSGTSDASGTTAAGTVYSTRQIFVEAPVGAEVYLDGSYIGIAPANTEKVTGQHVLTLSKAGYTTRSYTINVDSQDRDVTFSFSDLIAE